MERNNETRFVDTVIYGWPISQALSLQRNEIGFYKTWTSTHGSVFFVSGEEIFVCDCQIGCTWVDARGLCLKTTPRSSTFVRILLESFAP